MSIEQTWQRIHRFAAEHAPSIVDSLSGPASDADLAALQALELPVPESLLASLRIHDGEHDDSWGELLAGGGRLLGAAAIVATRDMLEDALRDFKPEFPGYYPDAAEPMGIGPVRPLTHSPAWLPIIDLNGDVTWFLDFDPADGGVPGQVIRVDAESSEWVVCAESWDAFLQAYADALESGAIEIEDGEPAGESPWPPLDRLPRLQPPALDVDGLFAVGHAGRWDVAAAVLQRHPLPIGAADRARIDAHAMLQAGDVEAAIAALDVLRGLGEERADDTLLRISLLDDEADAANIMAELGQAIERADDPRLRAERARQWQRMSGTPPFEASHAEAMRWLASPPGQQHAATCIERAVADYRAALAMDDRIGWQFSLARCLLDAEQWDAAEAEYSALLKRIEDSDVDDAIKEGPLEDASHGLQQAQSREVEDPSDMLDTLKQLLGAFGDSDRADSLRSMLGELEETSGSLRELEAAERAELDADPDSTDRRARHVAEQIARHHADTPERFAPFDATALDADTRRFHDRAQRELEALGYRHLADVEPLRNTEASGNRVMMRLLVSADASSVAASWQLANAFTTMEVVELESLLPDGRVLITNNSGAANPFESPAEIHVEALPVGTATARIDSAHRLRLGHHPAACPLADLDAILALQERLRLTKREFARRRGWVSDAELRSMLGGSYVELGEAVRRHLGMLLPV